jgi:hypothetical protein
VYRGMDQNVHSLPAGESYLSDMSIWWVNSRYIFVLALMAKVKGYLSNSSAVDEFGHAQYREAYCLIIASHVYVVVS